MEAHLNTTTELENTDNNNKRLLAIYKYENTFCAFVALPQFISKVSVNKR